MGCLILVKLLNAFAWVPALRRAHTEKLPTLFSGLEIDTACFTKADLDSARQGSGPLISQQETMPCSALDAGCKLYLIAGLAWAERGTSPACLHASTAIRPVNTLVLMESSSPASPLHHRQHHHMV
jgi:hypothetical protein